MKISEFDFELPEELIAQSPLARRDESRMILLDRSQRTFSDKMFCDLPEILGTNDVVVLNNTKVFPARLFGRKETGASIEIFLLHEESENIWQILARPSKRLEPGTRIYFDENLSALVLRKQERGTCDIQFETKDALWETIERIGKTPLPPYIKQDENRKDRDRERYQTIYAKKRGAVAAPTAGLHFTPEILSAINSRGAKIVEVTLHVGYGTFEPVRVEETSEHRVAPEAFEIDECAASTLNSARKNGQRIIAVGTTTARALESVVSQDGEIRAGKGSANITVLPGYRFKFVDALLTNFHLPKSSLLFLVSAFAGHDFVMRAYKHAIDRRYRFYSYGDCMLIL
jgi:S-adenosylmethionine:tRNA ribosyltransferase-isomerase